MVKTKSPAELNASMPRCLQLGISNFLRQNPHTIGADFRLPTKERNAPAANLPLSICRFRIEPEAQTYNMILSLRLVG